MGDTQKMGNTKKNESHFEKWVNFRKMCLLKNGSQLGNCVTVREMGHRYKCVTARGMGHT